MFKVGDIVRRKEKHISARVGYNGDLVKVTDVFTHRSGVPYIIFVAACGAVCHGRQELFELAEEEKVATFDLKTMPWYITTQNVCEFRAAQDWLFSQDVGWGNVGKNYLGDSLFHRKTVITNVNYNHETCDYIMWLASEPLAGVPEIKVSYETTVKVVEYPEIESEKDKEISKLKEEMQALAERLKSLEGV